MTGSECTGKTTLAQALARRHGTLWIPEAARVHAEGKPGPLGLEDVEAIARRHMEAADAAAGRVSDLLILDTDLVSTLVYSRHYYGRCPAWIAREAEARLADLYLLHHPDVPWIADPARDRPAQREEVHALFVETLAALGARVVDVLGSRPAREARAARAIDALLAEAGGRRR
jgi:NadR type nicotinamide-nucleotide adenylyltransferase